MMTTASKQLSDSGVDSRNDTRVLDSGRALAIMASGVLVAGFVALRMLAGDSAAPTVEAQIDQALPTPPVVEERDETIHRLRPQTSSGLSAGDSLRTEAPPLVPVPQWSEAPASFFAPVEDAEGDSREVDLARQHNILR